jgi:hypothetical protein
MRITFGYSSYSQLVSFRLAEGRYMKSYFHPSPSSPPAEQRGAVEQQPQGPAFPVGARIRGRALQPHEQVDDGQGPLAHGADRARAADQGGAGRGVLLRAPGPAAGARGRVHQGEGGGGTRSATAMLSTTATCEQGCFWWED